MRVKRICKELANLVGREGILKPVLVVLDHELQRLTVAVQNVVATDVVRGNPNADFIPRVGVAAAAVPHRRELRVHQPDPREALRFFIKQPHDVAVGAFDRLYRL